MWNNTSRGERLSSTGSIEKHSWKGKWYNLTGLIRFEKIEGCEGSQLGGMGFGKVDCRVKGSTKVME